MQYPPSKLFENASKAALSQHLIITRTLDSGRKLLPSWLRFWKKEALFLSLLKSWMSWLVFHILRLLVFIMRNNSSYRHPRPSRNTDQTFRGTSHTFRNAVLTTSFPLDFGSNNPAFNGIIRSRVGFRKDLEWCSPSTAAQYNPSAFPFPQWKDDPTKSSFPLSQLLTLHELLKVNPSNASDVVYVFLSSPSGPGANFFYEKLIYIQQFTFRSTRTHHCSTGNFAFPHERKISPIRQRFHSWVVFVRYILLFSIPNCLSSPSSLSSV